MAAVAQDITTEYNLQQFVEKHYITDGEHVGNVMIWATRFDGSLYQVGYERADKLGEKIRALRLLGQHKDIYLSANAFSGCKRRLEQLFSYHNIVIDIDAHLPGADPAAVAQRNHQIDALAYLIEEDLATDPDAIAPNTINKTGRGLQLWWSLEPTAASQKEKVEQLRSRLLDQLEKLLEDAGEALSLLSLDRGASNNDAGLFRMPGSYNRKTRHFGTFWELNGEAVNVFEEYTPKKRAAVHQNGTKRASGHHASIINLQKDVKAFLGLARVRQSALERLVSLRMEQGSIIGSRDEFIFQTYAAWANVYEDHESIMEKVEKVNGLFDHPLTQKELERYLSSSKQKRYRITNKTMIERLEISEQEQAALGLYPGGNGQNNIREQLRQDARDKKRDRNQKILSLWDAGERQQDIAEAAGCSLRTVKNVIKAAGAGRSDKLAGIIAQGIVEGLTAKEIARDAGCSIQTAYAYIKKMQPDEPRQDAPGRPENDHTAAGAQNIDHNQATAQERAEAGDSTLRNQETTAAGSGNVIQFRRDAKSHSKKCKKRLVYYFRSNRLEVPGEKTETENQGTDTGSTWRAPPD